MDIIQLNRDSAESVRIAFKNVAGGGSITTGYGVALVASNASFGGPQDAPSAVTSTAATIKNFLGVSRFDVPINGFGKATIWGYAASIVISNVGSSITVTGNDTLIPGAVGGTWFSSVTDAAMTTVLNKYIVNGQTQTISALSWVQGFVRGF